MSYHEALAELVKKSGLTLQEIADKCELYGIKKISPSYISKLQSGKQPPASDDVTIALAKACEGNPDDLLFEGYIEKAPKLIKDFIRNTTHGMRKFFTACMLPFYPKHMQTFLKSQLKTTSDREMIQMIAKVGIKQLHLRDLSMEMRRMKRKDRKTDQFLRELLGIPMPDDSMAPILPKNSRIVIKDSVTFSSGDIVLAVLPDDTTLIRRYISSDNKVILMPENRSYEVETFNAQDITVAGKVVSVSIDL
ncbi:MAG: LexA family transcriptional regulator [Bacillota bacterium]